VRIAYVDSSLVVRHYLPDEPGQPEASAIIEDEAIAIVTAPLTRIEVSGALVRAARSRRVESIGDALDRLDDDFDGGLITMIGVDDERLHRSALQIVRDHGLRALDAIHIATALLAFPELVEDDDEAMFIGRDDAQRSVAELLGLVVG
jgi:uncharacterized protein